MRSANEYPLSDDILRGASQIALFLFGDATERRKVYYLIESGQLPHFRLGAVVCARRSVLLAWIQSQEAAGLGRRPINIEVVQPA